MSAFLELYESLPRQGPGDRASLDFALKIIGVGRDQRILDAAWEAYYAPLQNRIADLTSTAQGDMVGTRKRAQAEIDGWRAVRGETGYLQIVAERT